MRHPLPNAISRARELRRNSTDVEGILWQHLRSRQLAGYKFRRQQPLGSYIVDFVCQQGKLVVELDGGQHDEERAADAQRDEWLRLSGYRVLRFWNHDVLENRDGVLSVILEVLRGGGAP